ncbi:MAG TPA: HEAT repeat domain-containing protein [Pyrinomonadaceae bacterium]
MKKESTGHDFAAQKNAAAARRRLAPLGVRLGLIAAAGASLFAFLPDGPHAQQRFKEQPVRVTSVTSSGDVVSIAADGPLNRAQTWQDAEGFHVVLVNGEAAAGAARGVKVQRIGNSLELVVPVRRGSNVTVQPRGNRLDLVVSGGRGEALSVENFPVEQRRQERAPARESAREASPASGESAEAVLERVQQPRQESKRQNPAGAEAQTSSPVLPQSVPTQQQQPAPPPAQTAEPAQTATTLGPAPEAQAPTQGPQKPVVAQPAAAQLDKSKGFDLLSLVTSLPSLLVLLGVALAGVGAMLVHRRRAGAGEADAEPLAKRAGSEEQAVEKSVKPFEHFKGDRRQSDVTVPFERRKSGRGAEDEATRRARELAAEGGAQTERPSEAKSQPGVTAVVFGSYRIDQEVASLVAGDPHSTEILCSRAADDRRAVETSLLKALRAPETDEDGRRRARIALEDYGFVARSCASLLLGTETFERVSAARALGDMKSAQALPFLTEALYDPDAVVRAECVQSLGALGLPSAIGALLDVARRHQDLPASILRPALTACSVESLELTWDSPVASRTFSEAPETARGADETRMIVPVCEGYEELPESVEDETLSAALVRLESTEAETRAAAARQLAQFQVRCAVRALAASAQTDGEPAVRSSAVTSLGLINHESVFASVIVALADEAREVRAAAARALSRLSFDRTDAYVRLVETADPRTLRDVAHACVKAGLAAQALSRLTSEDRRQAYEAFSLLSLCVTGGEPQLLIDAVESHQNIDTRLTCIQLLGDSKVEEVRQQLRRLAGDAAVTERVRRSILETVERAPAPVPVEVG